MIQYGFLAALALGLVGMAQATELPVADRIATLGVMGFRADELAKAGGTTPTPVRNPILRNSLLMTGDFTHEATG